MTLEKINICTCVFEGERITVNGKGKREETIISYIGTSKEILENSQLY